MPAMAPGRVDFSPNPLRRHSRGKRGKNKAATADFYLGEESKEDFYSKKIRTTARERQRRECASAKNFALRGLRASDKKVAMRNAKREGRRVCEVRQQLAEDARKTRVKLGLEGKSKSLRRFEEQEGLAKHKSNVLPWQRHVPHRKVKISPIRDVTWLGEKLKRFARDRSLPCPTRQEMELLAKSKKKNAERDFSKARDSILNTVSLIQSIEAQGLDGSTIRRMIEAMLLIAGIEFNPGPDCPLSGQIVPCEKYRMKKTRKIIWICKSCRIQVSNPQKVDDEWVGRHPQTEALPGTSNENSVQPLESAHNDVSQPPLSEEVVVGAACRVRSDMKEYDERPSYYYVFAGKVLDKFMTLPVVNLIPRVVEPVVEVFNGLFPLKSGTYGLPSDSMERSKIPPLSGVKLSVKDCERVMSNLCGTSCKMSEISIREKVIPYSTDSRLVSNRNVIETKSPLHVVEMEVQKLVIPVWKNVKILTSLAGTAVLTNLVHQFVNRVSDLVPCMLKRGGLLINGLNSVVRVSALVVGALAFAYLWKRFNARMGIFDYTPRRPYVLTFSPHIVSSVLCEYDRGTNAVSAVATMRQRIRRYASLPIPDVDSVKIIAGLNLLR